MKNAGKNDGDIPRLDDETRSRIAAQEGNWFWVAPPAEDAVTTTLTAVDTVTLALMDPTTAPYLATCFAEHDGCNLEEAVERLTLVAGELEILRQGAMANQVPDSRGRPKLAPWLGVATEMLVEWFQTTTQGEVRPYFKNNDAREPGNAFTGWFCDTLADIFPTTTRSNCKTLLQQHFQKRLR